MNSPTATRFAQDWFDLTTTYLCLFLLLNYDWFVLHHHYLFAFLLFAPLPSLLLVFLCSSMMFECRESTWNVFGRTARNRMLSEALVFHQTLSTPKAGYIGRFRRAHPKGELEQSIFFFQDPIIRMSL